MDSPVKWIIGNGLGKNVYIEKPSLEAARWYYKDSKHDYIILTHSVYIWSLYFGGIIGVILLAALMISAGLQALLCSIKTGYTIPLAMMMFGTIWMLADGHGLLIDYGNVYQSFWIPIALAAGLTRNSVKRLCKPHWTSC